MGNDKTIQKIDIVNKKARFNFEFIQTFTAGLQLHGTEIKSIREGKMNLTDGYCYFKSDELWVKNVHISPYKQGTYNNHEPLRIRKLLLQRRELTKLQNAVKEKGLTIVPYRVFLSERNLIKMEIALAKGKKLHDKRESIKEKDSKRAIATTLKNSRKY
ncbi:MAG: SsrA-binding protein SmpB [Chitinophagales bacterium]|nr:SsrA-binding protein SmpB [Chitinophagales bacterium]MCZ2394497.1 SsrA-binding protein SmpB [Chitinophagales bacterium]